MVIPGAFPLVKLGALAFRQIAKPLANQIKIRAKSSPFFRDYVCMPPAQLYHWIEVNVKMRMLNLGKPREVQKLNQNAAIELGADLLGEFIIFGAAVVTIVAEYVRQANKSAKEAAELEARWNGVENRIGELEYLVNKQCNDIQELTKQLVVVNSGLFSKASPHNTGKPETPVTQGVISKAIEEAKDKFTVKRSS